MITNLIMNSCKLLLKGVGSIIISLGLFLAVMAFHMISFVACFLLSSGIVFGLTLTFSYFARRTLPNFVETNLILLLLSYLSKFHVAFYYKLIYPGDNYDRSCWSFLKKVTRLIYVLIASYAFLHIFLQYLRKVELRMMMLEGQDGDVVTGTYWGIDIGSILGGWAENKYFVICMGILVHLFSLSHFKDYQKMSKHVPLWSCRCTLALLYSLALQSFYTLIYFAEFYFVHAWIPFCWIGAHALLYGALTGLSLVLWVLQVTACELFTDKLCSFTQRNQAPYFWYQNLGRGRLLVLKCVLVPLVVCLFYCDYDPQVINRALKEWSEVVGRGGGIFPGARLLIPAHNTNPTLFFLAFFSTAILQALKTLMMLKKGMNRLIYWAWLFIFCMDDLFTGTCCSCCDSDSTDDLSEVTSGTAAVSELTLDESVKLSRSRDDNDGDYLGKNKRKFGGGGYPPRTAHDEAREGFGGDQRRTGSSVDGDSFEDVREKALAGVNKSGIGDHNINTDWSHSGQEVKREEMETLKEETLEAEKCSTSSGTI